DRNFRSRREVTESVNAVFRNCMHRDMGGVEYDAAQALTCGADYYPETEGTSFQTEVLLADGSEYEDGPFESKVAFEATVLAEKIRSLLEEGRCTDKDTGELRRVRFSDIAILHRSANAIAGTYQDVLKDYGIPSKIVSVTGYFSAMEVETVLSLLRLLNNPLQDVALASVMHSPLFSFSDEELAKIRLAFPEERFFKAVFLYAEQGDSKTQTFLEKINNWREQVNRTPLYELLTTILRETGYLAYVSALSGGEARKRNLEKLCALSIRFEKTSYKGLFYFVHYIERMQKYEQDFGQAEGDAAEDAVSIMTIHKSKGLEFPIVFLAGAAKGFRGRPEPIVIHPDFGLGLYAVNLSERTKSDTVYRAFLSYRNDLEDRGEEQRILYVALTRAKEKLIVVGVGDPPDTALEKAAVSMTALTRRHAKCYLDWILPVAVQNPDLFEVHSISLEDLVLKETASQVLSEARLQKLKELIEQTSDDLKQWCRAQISFSYPHLVSKGIKGKYSVSELKRRSLEAAFEEGGEGEKVFDLKEREPYIPRFVSGKSPVNEGAKRGTAFHRYLECFDFSAEQFSESYAAQKERMRQEGRISEEETSLLLERPIRTFLQSSLAERMHRAAKRGWLKKEAAFVMMDEASHFLEEEEDAGQASDEPVLVQGIIDAFFEEEDGIVLLDYKTDRVETAEELQKRYQKQMALYADALGRTQKKEIKEIVLYSFALGKEIQVGEEVYV
ncbi:MAG: PD-(D/E)XK nuclease family protein, partial [Lachnospiraceae bacterium]|nr:PD-(D/E)XK nuclease family protein [Lachnospiraceae bacterium]